MGRKKRENAIIKCELIDVDFIIENPTIYIKDAEGILIQSFTFNKTSLNLEQIKEKFESFLKNKIRRNCFYLVNILLNAKEINVKHRNDSEACLFDITELILTKEFYYKIFNDELFGQIIHRSVRTQSKLMEELLDFESKYSKEKELNERLKDEIIYLKKELETKKNELRMLDHFLTVNRIIRPT